MSPKELRDARETLGLSLSQLAETLKLRENGERLIRRWESGEQPISGPASAAVELLLVVHACRQATRPWLA